MYDAFISYSHAADGRLAPALQAGLHQLGKPWYRLRALRVFRDKTSLSATPALWPTIVQALENSRWFLLMASPDAARSVWVQHEIAWWIEHRDPKTMLILLTGGDLAWDQERQDFDWARSSAIPQLIANKFPDEPLYVDLRQLRNAERLTLRNSPFRAAVLDVAAPIHGRPKDELDGEDVRQHRRARQIAWAAVALLMLLTVLSIAAAYVAIRQRNVAVSRELALYSAAALDGDPELSVILAQEAVLRARTSEAEGALRQAMMHWPALATIRSFNRGPTAARFNRDGSRLITAWERGTAEVWNPDTGERFVELRGHTDVVADAVFSPDGTRAATASWDKTVRIWDAASGTLHFELRHPQIVTSVRFSHDGSTLASGTGDGRAYLWDARTGRKKSELSAQTRTTHHFTFATNVAFSPDGSRLATSGGSDLSFGVQTAARVWAVPDGNLLFELAGHSGLVTQAAFSPDGRTLATTGADGTARLWDATTGKPLAVLRGAGAPLTSLALSPDGLKLAATTTTGTVYVWDIVTRRLDPKVRIPEGSANVSVFSQDSRMLLTAGNTARLWDLPTGTALLELRGHYERNCCAEFRPDGRAVVTAGADRTVRVWDIASPRRVLEMHVTEGGVTAAEFSADGRYVLTTGAVLWTLWDAAAGKLLSEIRRGQDTLSASFDVNGSLIVADQGPGWIRFRQVPGDAVRAVLRGNLGDVRFASLSPDRNRAAVGDQSGVRLWDARNGREIARMDGAERIVAFSASSQELLTVGPDSVLTIWDTAAGTKKAEFEEQASVRAARFSPTGEYLLAVAESNNARVWDVRRNKLHAELAGHMAWINDGAFRPDGAQLLTAGSDKTARTWDFATGRLLATLAPPGTVNVDFAAFSKDGRYIVTSGPAFGNAHVWRGADGKLIATLPVLPQTGRFATVNTAAFSPDGKTILTASNDGFARIFPSETFLPIDEIMAMARKRANRSLTSRERYSYFHEGAPELRPE